MFNIRLCARQRETQVNPERKGVLMTSGEINKNASKCMTAKQKEGCLPLSIFIFYFIFLLY